MAATQTPEQRELALVGKVEMRIALTDSDDKLQAMLKTYLAPLLLKLASEHVSVRNKVISICQHISTRIRPQTIQLPVAALVKQFKEQDNSMVRHFDFLYIQQGVGRLPSKEKAELLPVTVSDISNSGSHGAQIFNLLLRLLDSFPLPPRGSKDDLELRTQLRVTDGDAKYLAMLIGKLMLFIPQKGTMQTCPGLTKAEYASLTLQGKDDLWKPAEGGLNLLRTKTLAAKLMASGLFTDQERFIPALFASTDPASSISDVGDDMMKRALPAMDLEDEDLVKYLLDLYFGIDDAPRVRAPLRLKILGLLNKSTRSTTFANRIMRLVDDGVANPATDGDDTVMGNAPATTNVTIGREATKVRAAIFQYINFVARYGSSETLHAISPRVVARLREFIDDQGWPKPGESEDLVSRGYAYEVVGLLAKAGPRNLLVEDEHPNLDILRWLFESLARDTSGNAIIVSIEEAMSTVLSAMSRMSFNVEEQQVIEELLIDQMSRSGDLPGHKRIRSTRYVTVRFANRCLPYTSVKARWIDLLGIAAAGDRAEVREEAERGLSPYWHRMLNGSLGALQADSVDFPAFADIMSQFFPGRTIEGGVEAMARAQQSLRSNTECFSHMTEFARRMLFQEAMSTAGIPANIDGDWERRIDASAESDMKAREAVKARMRQQDSAAVQPLEILLCALFINLTDHTAIPDTNLVEILALSPDTLVEKLVPHIDALMLNLASNSHARRTTAARTFGIIASHPAANPVEVARHIRQLLSTAEAWNTAVGAAASKVHGAVLALGYYYSGAVYRGSCGSDEDQHKELAKICVAILNDSRDQLLREGSYMAIGRLCMFGVLTHESLSRVLAIPKLVDKIYETAKSGNEQAILCLGEISMVAPEGHSDLKNVTDQLHKLHEIRQAEVHFTVGEALSYVASGWKSSALATKIDIDGLLPSGLPRTTTLQSITEQVLGDCGNTKPALKKAAVMWLLCLVQFCGDQNDIQDRLPKCQVAFKRCLSDRDELVQESASRGLGLIYEKGDRRLKDDLVRDLIGSFSSDRQSQLAGTVSADTQLFEPGALPTGDGSVSTYKDIMSLASEVGDSSLVYKFMSMASSNAIWSSRAAFGRFGLSNVLSDSSVDGYLADNPKLYPKLFRYRFDPNSGVQRSMNDIWNALVKDSTATIEKYFDNIMEDLLSSILGKEWRVRQACCAAIADLVQGRSIERYEQYLERIWTQCFKVLDDIKESVRAAATSLARTMTGILTRALESDHSSTKNASAMLKHVLPFLLSPSGMESSAQEVQAFSVHTLLDIIKKSNGKTLRPFIPELVDRLLSSLSSLEPEAVNYLHLNASKYNLTEQKIDDMRLSSIRSSPLMEAVERCLDLLDDDSMKQLQPRLESAMKSAVGLPSKVGASRVLVSLSTRRIAVFRPFADAFLKLIEKVILDRNETVSSSYAVASGYLARVASDKQLLRLMNFAQGLYFKSEGDREASVPRRSITSGEIVYATSKHASDKFNAIAASVLPFVFVAEHDPHNHVKEQFQSAWDESVGGSRAVSLYLKEIVALSESYLDSPQWILKHTSARAIADAVTAVAGMDSGLSSEAAATLWPALEKALSGKTWEGKETVLSAFAKFVESARPFYSQRKDVAASITKVMTREAKRQNATYRQHSIRCLARVCRARTDIDMSGTVCQIVEPLLEEPADEDAMDIDSEKSSQNADASRQVVLAAAVESLLASINPVLLDGPTLGAAVSRVLKDIVALPSPTAEVRRCTYDELTRLFKRLKEASVDGDNSSAISVDSQADLKHLLFVPELPNEALRLARADVITAVADYSRTLVSSMRAEILACLEHERSPLVRDRIGAAAPTEG